jgi:hypothetical protein
VWRDKKQCQIATSKELAFAAVSLYHRGYKNMHESGASDWLYIKFPHSFFLAR